MCRSYYACIYFFKVPLLRLYFIRLKWRIEVVSFKRTCLMLFYWHKLNVIYNYIRSKRPQSFKISWPLTINLIALFHLINDIISKFWDFYRFELSSLSKFEVEFLNFLLLTLDESITTLLISISFFFLLKTNFINIATKLIFLVLVGISS